MRSNRSSLPRPAPLDGANPGAGSRRQGRRPIYSARAVAALSVLALLFLAFSVACRMDGLVRFSTDLAERLTDGSRAGEIDVVEKLGEANIELEPGDLVAVFFAGGQEMEGIEEPIEDQGYHYHGLFITALGGGESGSTGGDDPGWSGNPTSADFPRPDGFQRAFGVELDLPGGVEILEQVGLSSGLSLANVGGGARMVDPRVELWIAPEEAADAYDSGDGSVRIGVLGIDGTLDQAAGRRLELELGLGRDDPAFDIAASGAFQLGFVLLFEYQADGGAENPASLQLGWDVEQTTLTVSGRPRRALP